MAQFILPYCTEKCVYPPNKRGGPAIIKIKRRFKTPSPPTFIFWLLFHFSRGQNGESHSSVYLCSETKWKRLLRRLQKQQATNQTKNNLLEYSVVRIIQLDQGNVMGGFNWVVFLMKDYSFHREFLTLWYPSVPLIIWIGDNMSLRCPVYAHPEI